jgi:hypothetical protein
VRWLGTTDREGNPEGRRCRSAQINREPDSESTYGRDEALPQSRSCFGLTLGRGFWGLRDLGSADLET